MLDRQKRADAYSARLREDHQVKRAQEQAEAAAEVRQLEEKAQDAARRHREAQEVFVFTIIQHPHRTYTMLPWLSRRP